MEHNAFEWGTFSRKALRSIAQSHARINIWHGAVRSGKTVSSQVRWLDFIRNAPRQGHLLMTGVTVGTLKDNILDPIADMVGPKNYHYAAGSREVHICGRRCLIRGANDEAAEKKIRGLTLAGVYGDEITLWPENFFKRCLDRLSVDGAALFGTTNPDSPYHWLKTDYLDREADLDLKSFHFELQDNPNLPKEYIENLKREFTGLWYKRFIQGLWVVAEGAVYDMFDDALHVIQTWDELPGWDEPHYQPPWEKVHAGLDYGTGSPTATIAAGLWKGTWYAFAEDRHEGAADASHQQTDSQHSERIREFFRRGGIVPQTLEVDPSAASMKAQLKRDGVRGTKNADHDVLDGIRVVASALTNGTLKIHESCLHLRKEFATYVWDPKAQEERGEDKPIKQHDHSLDALRYLVMRAIGRPPKNIHAKPSGA